MPGINLDYISSFDFHIKSAKLYLDIVDVKSLDINSKKIIMEKNKIL